MPANQDTTPAGVLIAERGQQCAACGCLEYVPLFEGTDRLYRTTDKVFHVVECRRCRLIRLMPRPAPEELVRYYPREYWLAPGHALGERLVESYRRLVLRDHLDFAEEALRQAGEGGLVVDVGCGGGLFLALLKERGCRVLGLDFSLEAARVAAQRGVPVVCASLTQAPLQEESCSLITMFHVLEHLYEPQAYVEAALRLLRSGGRLIVQVPNASSWQFWLLGENWTGCDIPRHLTVFRAVDLEGLLERCGFRTLRRKFFSLRDNPAALASSLAPWLDPMARRVRRPAENPHGRLVKDTLYFGLFLACLPFTLLEAACGAGCTVMVEAVKPA